MPNNEIVHATRRLLDKLKQHAVPEVLTNRDVADDIENAVKEVEYVLRETLG